MRPRADYVATQTIMSNGVRAYNRGDDVPASAVENLGLAVGVEVLPARTDVIPRPDADDARDAWARYAVGQGMTLDELEELGRDQIRGLFPVDEDSDAESNPAPDLVAEQATEQAAGVERPAQNARKPEWVEYAVWRGMQRSVADDSTVAQLQACDYDTLFGPEPQV